MRSNSETRRNLGGDYHTPYQFKQGAIVATQSPMKIITIRDTSQFLLTLWIYLTSLVSADFVAFCESMRIMWRPRKTSSGTPQGLARGHCTQLQDEYEAQWSQDGDLQSAYSSPAGPNCTDNTERPSHRVCPHRTPQ
jgi:hypothetical protein